MKQKTPYEFSLHLSRSEWILGTMYLAMELFLLPSALFFVSDALGGLSDAVTNFLFYVCNAVFCVLIFRPLLSRSVETAGERGLRFIGVTAGAFLALYAVMSLGNRMIAYLDPEFANVNDAAITAMAAESPWLLGIGTMLLVPFAEECLFRGLLFTPFYAKRRPVAYAVSTAAFCAVHVIGYVGMYPPETLALCFVQYIPAGLLLGWAYAASGSLFAPMLVHSAVNAVSFFALR